MSDNDDGFTVGFVLGALLMIPFFLINATFDKQITSGKGFTINDKVYKCYQVLDLKNLAKGK